MLSSPFPKVPPKRKIPSSSEYSDEYRGKFLCVVLKLLSILCLAIPEQIFSESSLPSTLYYLWYQRSYLRSRYTKSLRYSLLVFMPPKTIMYFPIKLAPWLLLPSIDSSLLILRARQLQVCKSIRLIVLKQTLHFLLRS